MNTAQVTKRMDSDTWLSIGTYFFQVPERLRGRWLAGETHLADKSKPFRFRCSRCEASFESITTPTKCPVGHDAGDEPEKVLLSHKGHVAATFPFDI